MLRQVGAYKLPKRLANERRHRGGQSAGREGARRIPGESGVSKPATLYNRLALIGVGLIGSSIARAARAQGAVRSIVATARSPQTRKRVAELGIADQVVETNAAAVEGADLVIVCIPVGACGEVAKEIGPHLAARRHRLRRRARSRAPIVRDMVPHLPDECAFRAGASGRRHRIFRPRRRLCRTVRQPLVHPDAARRRRCRGGRQARLVLAPARRQCRDDVSRSPRPGARHHQPSAASDRLHHRRHRRRNAGRDALRRC